MTMQVDALPDTAGLVGTYVLRDQSYEQLAADEDLGMAIGNTVAIADLYPDNSLGLWEAESQEWSLLEHPVPGVTGDGLKTLTWLMPEETAEARITAVLAQDGKSLLRVTWIYESFIEGDEDYGEGRDAGTMSITKVTSALESKLGVLTVTAVTAGENPLAGLLDLPPINDGSGRRALERRHDPRQGRCRGQPRGPVDRRTDCCPRLAHRRKPAGRRSAHRGGG